MVAIVRWFFKGCLVRHDVEVVTLPYFVFDGWPVLICRFDLILTKKRLFGKV